MQRISKNNRPQPCQSLIEFPQRLQTYAQWWAGVVEPHIQRRPMQHPADHQQEDHLNHRLVQNTQCVH